MLPTKNTGQVLAQNATHQGWSLMWIYDYHYIWPTGGGNWALDFPKSVNQLPQIANICFVQLTITSSVGPRNYVWSFLGGRGLWKFASRLLFRSQIRKKLTALAGPIDCVLSLVILHLTSWFVLSAWNGEANLSSASATCKVDNYWPAFVPRGL